MLRHETSVHIEQHTVPAQPWRLRSCTHLESVCISVESLVLAPRSVAQSFGLVSFLPLDSLGVCMDRGGLGERADQWKRVAAATGVSLNVQCLEQPCFCCVRQDESDVTPSNSGKMALN